MRGPARWSTAAAFALAIATAAHGRPARAQAAPATPREQAVVASARPDRVAVTVYRAPGSGPIDLRSPDGFALVTETRRIRLPAGPATVRFEGVAEGIVPVSAIVDGLPGGTVEKNRDARLLSPASLVDGTLGREVTLTRTDPATGAVRQERATIVAGPQPGVVLRTAAGIETLRCSGLPERLSYDRVPAGLSAEPVLSVATVTPRARTVTVTLSYLASGFDWRAAYVATVRPEGDRLDLFGWLTLANGNAQDFPAAEVQAVAGRLNREGVAEIRRAVAALRLRCYPLGTTTSDLPNRRAAMADEIVVTGARITAEDIGNLPALAMAAPPAPPPPPPPPPEDLGDLKLYRVPERVTVAPRAQKQVALLAREGVAFRRVYRARLYPLRPVEGMPLRVALRLRNEAEAGLGIALPAGGVTVYARRGTERLAVGAGSVGDTAAGEVLWLDTAESPQVTVTQVAPPANTGRLHSVTVANANPFAVDVEIGVGMPGQPIEGDALARIDGVATWTATLGPNEERRIQYRP